MTQHSSNDADTGAPCEGGLPCASHRQLGMCDSVLVGLVFWTLVHATEALAADQTAVPGGQPRPDFDRLRDPVPLTTYPLPFDPRFASLDDPQAHESASQDFRPRGPSLLGTPAGLPADEEMGSRGTIWERLAEFRAHNRVRLVTLWQAGGSSLSLQAGKKGDPTLQWTSRLMNHGAAPRGLLDELFSTSAGGTGRSLHFSRPTIAEFPAKPVRPAETGVGIAAPGVNK